MTVVADLLATVRADTSQFQSQFNEAEGGAKRLGEELDRETEKLLKVKDAAGIVATGIGGTFTAALVAAGEITKHYTAEIEGLRTSFTGLLGSVGAANNEIAQIEKMSAAMGVNTGSLANAARALSVYTENQVDATTALKDFNDIAAGTGSNVQAVTQAMAEAYALLQRSGPTSGGRVAMNLERQGFITPEQANEVAKMAQQGASMKDIWSVLTQEQDRFKGSGDAAANTMKGLSASFHALLDQGVGQAFEPIIKGVEDVIKAVNTFMSSNGFKTIVDEVVKGSDRIGETISSMAEKMSGLGASITSAGFSKFVGEIQSTKIEVAGLTGVLVALGSEFVGELPIIRRFSEPFIGFLSEGRAGLIGMLIATKDGRQALEDFAGAVIKFVGAFTVGSGPIATFLNTLTNLIAKTIEFTAGILNWVAENKVLISVIEGVVGAITALLIVDKITNTIGSFVSEARRMVTVFGEWLRGILTVDTAGREHVTVEEAQLASTNALNIALKELQTTLLEVASAQDRVTSSGASMSIANAQKINANLSNWGGATSTAELENAAGGMSVAGRFGVGSGLGLAGGALTMAGGAVGGGAGQAMQVAGMAATGAGLGTMIAPGIGTAIGAVAGLAAGFTMLALGAHHAADELGKIKNSAEAQQNDFNKAHPENLADYGQIVDRAKAAHDLADSATPEAIKQAKKDAAAAQVEFNNAQTNFDDAKKSGEAKWDPKLFAQDQQAFNDAKAANDAAQGKYTQLQGAKSLVDSGLVGNSDKAQVEAFANINTAATQTGHTFNEVAAEARKLDLSLDFDTATRSGKEKFDQLVAAMKDIPTSAQAMLMEMQRLTQAEVTNAEQNAAVSSSVIGVRDAQRALQSVLAQDPTLPVAQAQLSLSQAYLGVTQSLLTYNEAQRSLQKLLATDPNLPVAQASQTLAHAKLNEQSATYSLIDAQRAYNDSQIGSIGLTIKYGEAVLSVKDAQLASRDGAMSLLEAQTNLARARQFGASTLTIQKDESAVAHAQLGQQSADLNVTKTTHDLGYMQEDIASGKLQGQALIALSNAQLNVTDTKLATRSATQSLTQAQIDEAGWADKVSGAQLAVKQAALGVDGANLNVRSSTQSLNQAMLTEAGYADQVAKAHLGVESSIRAVITAKLALVQNLADLPGVLGNIAETLRGFGDSFSTNFADKIMGFVQQYQTTAAQQASGDVANTAAQAKNLGDSPDPSQVKNYMHTYEDTKAAIQNVMSFDPKGGQFLLDAFNQLPSFGVGGRVDKKMMALIGESGPELILPLNDMTRTAQLLQDAGLLGAMAGTSGRSGMSVSVGGAAAGATGNNTVVNHFDVTIDHVEDFDDFMAKMQAMARTRGTTSTTAGLNGAQYTRV